MIERVKKYIPRALLYFYLAIICAMILFVGFLLVFFMFIVYGDAGQQDIIVSATKQKLYAIHDSRGDNSYISISTSPAYIWGFHFVDKEKDYVYNERIYWKVSNDTVYIYCEKKTSVPQGFKFSGTIVQIELSEIAEADRKKINNYWWYLGLQKCPW